MPGTWQPLTNQPMFNTSTMILLTDGRVIVQEEGTAHWHALTPDSAGSYVNGTWSTLADMAFWRRYYASGVMKDGRVFLCGGEQSGGGGDTNLGQIYDPVTDAWSPIATPPWSQVGDAACCVVPDGRIMIGALLSGDCLIYNPVSDTWTPAANQLSRTNEETWILLPDNTIVTVDCFPPYHGKKYVISADTWQDEGALPVQIVDPLMSEVGPGMLLYNGKVIFFGAANSQGHGKTVLYTPPPMPTGVGTWAPGPDIPTLGRQVMVCNDCPGALLPNGKVLFAAANFVRNGWGSPVYFFEYDPASNTIAAAPTPPNNNTFPYPPYPGLYWSRMMLLPTGQVLYSASSKDVQCYTPVGGPQEAWRPTVSAVLPHGSPYAPDYVLLQGTQLNGLSQANIYGDDCYPATNYPLVQLTNAATHQVTYCRTYEFSTMGVATGPWLQSARFSVAGLPQGCYELVVIANGIGSHPISFCLGPSCPPACCPSACSCGCDPCGRGQGDGEVQRLKMQVKLLQNDVRWLASSMQMAGTGLAEEDIAKEVKHAGGKEPNGT